MSILPLLPFMPLQILSEFLFPILDQFLAPAAVVVLLAYILFVFDSFMCAFDPIDMFSKNNNNNNNNNQQEKQQLGKFNKEYILWKRYYNWCQVVFNLGMALYGFTCIVMDWPISSRLWLNAPDAELVKGDLFLNAHAFVVLHAWNKIMDLIDTLFIIYERQWKRLTFLHCYHHICTVLIWSWLAVNENGYCRPTIMFGAFLNSIIHALMYTYYNLSMHPKIGPWVRKHKLWLTGAQMVQLLLGCGHALVVGLLDTSCDELQLGWLVQFLFLSHLLYLFAKFFLREYSKDKTSKTLPNKKSG